MDLDYPSQKKNQLSNQLNQMDPRFGSIVMSNPHIAAPSKPIPAKLKKKILDFIYKDQGTKLIDCMNQQAISLCDQISKQGHGWTILHYIAKNNSQKCMELSLRWLYQSEPRNYEQITNQKNCDGDTPLTLCCLHKSNAVLKILLQYGGADIYSINSKKLSAYQIALTSVNQQALQLLMKYELKVKRRNSINGKALSLALPPPEESSWSKLYDWFIQCFYFGTNHIEPLKETETDRKMTKKQEQANAVSNIQICWLEPEKRYSKKLPLFSAVSHPFSIKQSNIIVSNLFIVFQALAEHPQLLKRIIFSCEDKFYTKLGSNKQQKLVWVDNLFPFFQQSQDPLFLSLEDQIWPMVLQKSLSQYYNGYFQPAKVPVGKLLQTITGNQYYSLRLTNNDSDEIKQDIKKLLIKIQQKNCILVLKSRQSCPLRSEQGRLECFSLLKILDSKLLINCPFLLSNQFKKQETRQMKLHQAHYHNSSCQTVWLETNQFFQYFQQAVFCYTLNTTMMKTNSIKVSATGNRLYINIKIKQRLQNDKIYLNFKSQSEGSALSPTKCVGWSIRGSQRQYIQKINCQILGCIQIFDVGLPGQILLMCEFDQILEDKKQKYLSVFCKCQQLVQMSALDCAIGDLQFIQSCKKYFNQYHDQFEAPIIQTVGDYLLIMAVSSQPCYIPLPESLTQDNIVEGLLVQNEAKLQMFQFCSIYFVVLSDIGFEVAKDLKIMSYGSKSEAGDSIIQNTQH